MAASRWTCAVNIKCSRCQIKSHQVFECECPFCEYQGCPWTHKAVSREMQAAWKLLFLVFYTKCGNWTHSDASERKRGKLQLIRRLWSRRPLSITGSHPRFGSNKTLMMSALKLSWKHSAKVSNQVNQYTESYDSCFTGESLTSNFQISRGLGFVNLGK